MVMVGSVGVCRDPKNIVFIFLCTGAFYEVFFLFFCKKNITLMKYIITLKRQEEVARRVRVIIF
jgi:hypothetical protein